ncbi:hypothetical protein N7466_011068 [Penicillium verhagenii]|uniref:uncharacterized protein n=1 Tax=Penicillium verhagenii TaxID=1562060 RepID=UPI002544D8C2|nr:uncharacterized protein N7466_011068 [Penicillium verhagenii]KAJ5917514.1 hypothetical protein N7466_011068 [Penicillium verhagenii]
MSEIVAGKERISPSRSAELVPTPDGVAINSNLSEGSGSADGERTRRETCGSSDSSVDRMERTSRQGFPREELPPTPLQIVEQQASPVGPGGQSSSHESLRRIQDSPCSAPPEENGNVYIPTERGTVTQTSILDKEAHPTGEMFSTIENCINGWKAVNQSGQLDGRESTASHPWDDKVGEEANGQDTANRPDSSWAFVGDEWQHKSHD